MCRPSSLVNAPGCTEIRPMCPTWVVVKRACIRSWIAASDTPMAPAACSIRCWKWVPHVLRGGGLHRGIICRIHGGSRIQLMSRYRPRKMFAGRPHSRSPGGNAGLCRQKYRLPVGALISVAWHAGGVEVVGPDRAPNMGQRCSPGIRGRAFALVGDRLEGCRESELWHAMLWMLRRHCGDGVDASLYSRRPRQSNKR